MTRLADMYAAMVHDFWADGYFRTGEYGPEPNISNCAAFAVAHREIQATADAREIILELIDSDHVPRDVEVHHSMTWLEIGRNLATEYMVERALEDAEIHAEDDRRMKIFAIQYPAK